MRGYNSSLTPRPRQPNTPVVSQAVTGVKVPLPNPYTPPIPSVAFDKTGQVRNIAACVTALKAGVESLTGQRGDLSNRAVTFKDLVDFGVLSQNAVGSSSGVSTGGGGGAGLPGPPGPPGPPGTASIFVGDIPPPMANGAAWFDAIGAQLYIGYQDANSTQWVPVANQPGPQGPPGTGSGPPGPPGVSIITADVAPSPTNGGAWWNSAEGQLYIGYQDANSTQWVRATNVEPGPPGPQGPPGTASSLITSVNAGNGLTGGGSAGDLLLSLFTPVSVANGGTGATDASGALTNLGAASVASLGNYLPLTSGTLSTGLTVINSSLNNGFLAYNGNYGQWISIFNDGNGHLECPGPLWLQGNNTGQAIHLSGAVEMHQRATFDDGFNVYGGTFYNAYGDGWLYFNGSLRVVNFNSQYDVTANRDVYASGSVYIGGLRVYNNGGWVYFENWLQAGNLTSRGNVTGSYINSYGDIQANGNITANGTINANNNQLQGGSVSVSGQIWTTNEVWANAGHHCKQGNAGGWGGNVFHFFWDGNGLQTWVDATYMGDLFSDYRIKKDVKPLSSMWERIKALRPVSYTQKEYTPPNAEGPLFAESDDERWGFFAHELQNQLVPSAATSVKDASDAIQGVNALTLLAALTRALQETMTRIEALEGKPA